MQIQCAEVIIQSCTDLQLGEKYVSSIIHIQTFTSNIKTIRFCNTDYAVGMFLRKIKAYYKNFCRKDWIKLLKILLSYDINCAYWINIIERFEKNFPDLVEIVKIIDYLIPLVHVKNHKPNCIYLFSCSYKFNTGHFHAETAEHVWPELNQLSTQTRQMNNGHRQDAIIDHHSDWNFKKVANMGMSLQHLLFPMCNCYSLSFYSFHRHYTCSINVHSKTRSFCRSIKAFSRSRPQVEFGGSQTTKNQCSKGS
jgi:hypothetical protein